MSSAPVPLQETVRVLAIEDEDTQVRFLRLIFESFLMAGTTFELDSCKTLADALTYLQSKSPDIILLDLGLPDSVGFKTFSMIHEAAPLVPIVVVTGSDDDDLMKRVMREGGESFMIKGSMGARAFMTLLVVAVERIRNARSKGGEGDPPQSS